MQNTNKKIQFRLRFKNPATGKRFTVTIFEPYEQDEGNPSLLMLTAATRCWKAISQDQIAQEATRTLNRKGGTWVFVLGIVEYYCQYFGPMGRKRHRDLIASLASLNKKIAKFEARVKKWEAEINEMNSSIENELPIDIATHMPSFAAYRTVLQVARELSLPSMMDLTRKKNHIVLLHHFAEVSTGKAHYKEIANILQARLDSENDAAMPEKTIDESTLKRTVKRFKQKDPEGYRKIETAVRALLKGALFADCKIPPVYVKRQN